MAKFLKIDLKTVPLNFNKVFFDDWPFDESVDKEDLTIFADYWKTKGIDWDYVMANPDNMGYSITNADEDVNFFLIPYLDNKLEELQTLIAGKPEVDKYTLLEEDPAKEIFSTWRNAYLDKIKLTEDKEAAELLAAETAQAALEEETTEVDKPEDDLAKVLENLE